MIHVYEWAKHLVKLGYSVQVICISYTRTIRKLYNSSGIEVCNLNEVVDKDEFDIVFAYHFPIITFLLSFDLIYCRKLVLGSLSPFEPLESLPLFWKNSSLITVISQEILQKTVNLIKVPYAQIKVFENCVPDDFAFCEKTLVNDKPLKIAIISNHIPDELRQLSSYLPSTSKITYLGSNERSCSLVTPQTLIKFDLIISIGKTVNYALCMGIPVFEYDYFGGCGYISRINFDLEVMTNFSGRASMRRCPPHS